MIWTNVFDPSEQIVEAQTQGICDRSLTVQLALLSATDEKACEDVSATDLASIDFLYLSFFAGGLVAGDLDGLTRLDWLGLRGRGIFPFPNGVFDDLTNLEFLYVRDDAIASVAADSFSGLSALNGLSYMVLVVPAAATIDAGALNGLGNLEYFNLSANELTTIPTGTFASLANLEILRIQANAITDIQAGMFNGLGNLEWLIFLGSGVTTVENGAFSGVGELVDDTMRKEDGDYGVIYLVLDAITSLESNIFSGLSNLERLAISGDALATLQPDMLAGLDSLEVLYIDGGGIATIQPGVFDDFPTDHVLTTLRLDRGAKEILASGVLTELPEIEAIDIWDPTMTTIEAGFFRGLTTLKRLFFDDAGNISRVERGSFADLTELTLLNLSNNKITSLPDDIFDGLRNLEVLELGGNPLVRLPAGFVASPPCGLTTFDISGHGLGGIPTALIDGFERNILASLPQPGVNGCGPDQGIRHLILDDIPLTQADLDLIEPYKVLETLSVANTGITAEQAIDIRRGQDLATLKSLNLSRNDLSGLNRPLQRTALGIVLGRLINLEELHLAETKIDGDTALVIVQNVNSDILELSLAGNNLVEWNHPDLEHNLVSAWSRLWQNWDLIDLSDTAINSQSASAIVPYIERTHEGIPEEVVAELDSAGFHTGVTLDLSNNYLTHFGPSWLRDWEYVNIVDLSCNDLTTLRPEWFKPVSRHIEVLILRGNPFDPQLNRTQFEAMLPNAHLHTFLNEPCQRTNYSVPKSVARVLRIEPSIRSIAIKPGRTVRLEVDVYGRQDLLDNSLADSVYVIWDDEHVGGSFSGTGRSVEYTVPDRPLGVTVIARVGSEQCYGSFDQCTAHFEIKVNRASTAIDDGPVPVNPGGQIPSLLIDDLGTNYEVFTPVGGGQYAGNGFGLVAPSGAVPNGEFIGISVRQGEAASNVGQTHHRYTLAGVWHHIDAVDSNGQPLADYQLNRPAQVCIPLPDPLRSNIDDVAVVAVGTGSASFTVLSSRVRLQPHGAPQLCGNLSFLPAKIAAARSGPPEALPTAVLSQPEGGTLPDTGGNTSPVWALILVATIGASLVLVGLARPRSRRLG